MNYKNQVIGFRVTPILVHVHGPQLQWESIKHDALWIIWIDDFKQM